MQKHKLVRLGELKMQEADEWRLALVRHTGEYYRGWLLERFVGELIALYKRGERATGDPVTHTLLSRIQIDAHDARLDAELNLETSKKLVISSEVAARVYFEEYEHQWDGQ